MKNTTLEKLKDIITNEHKIDDKKPDTHTKIYTIHTILYAIVTVWLRFLKDKNIDVLFEQFPNEIKTLLEQCKESDIDDATKLTACAKSLAVGEHGAIYVDTTARSVLWPTVADYASDSAAADHDTATERAAETAYYAARRMFRSAYFPINMPCSAEERVEEVVKYVGTLECSKPERAILYLISAYLYLKI